MSYIKIHQEKITDANALKALCPFGAIEENAKGELEINAGCKMCRLCVKRGDGVFEFVEETNLTAKLDKSAWKGICVVAEIDNGNIHPVTFELLGKARELAQVVNEPVYCVMAGENIAALAEQALIYGADDVFVYDDPALKYFRVEPYTAVLEDFIHAKHPSVMLVGGTTAGRSLAPRTAARFKTGLTADCTKLEIQPTGDLDQIRPAYGGNIMAHINTPNHRPQFATVRYKIFPIPPKREISDPEKHIHLQKLAAEKLVSAIDILEVREKAREIGIEDAEVIIAAGRGLKKKEDLAMIRELAELLNGQIAGSRAVIEAGWLDPRCQIGLSGRTVKPKLIIACGISGAIQFVAGMSGSEKIIAINSDPDAPIFKVAHIGLTGDLYKIVPALIEKIKASKNQE